MVGSLYYLLYKSDFEMSSAYEMFQRRKLRRLIRRNKFDDEKIEFLEQYVKMLREQIGTLKNEGEEFSSAV
jgi:pantothenate kinase-related protein Tda10